MRRFRACDVAVNRPNRALTCLLLTVLLAGCQADPRSPVERSVTAGAPTAEATVESLATTAGPPLGQCAQGRLTIGDLTAVDAAWRQGLSAATVKATAWQADARLVAFRVGCQPLEAVLRWQGRFYSSETQAFFLSDTGGTTPAEVAPELVQTMPTDVVSFRRLRRALLHASFQDSTELSPVSGVEVRLSTAEDPFGPPEAPRNTVYYHVAIPQRGEIKDLFVSASDGTIYAYR